MSSFCVYLCSVRAASSSAFVGNRHSAICLKSNEKELPEEETMRNFIFAAAAATTLTASAVAMGGVAQAAMTGTGVRTAVEDLNTVENIQFRFEGRRHCWYGRGWNGPGWYWCGYHQRRGHGWGGGDGWNGWRHR